MDKYEELINLFSLVLRRSKDYHIAYIWNVGYAAFIGILDERGKQSVIIDEIFSSPDDMAESFLQNWKWQWLYEHRQGIKLEDYDDISQIDRDMNETLRREYFKNLREIEGKISDILLRN